MASAAKRRRQDQEDGLVRKTVEAVLLALEQIGVIHSNSPTNNDTEAESIHNDNNTDNTSIEDGQRNLTGPQIENTIQQVLLGQLPDSNEAKKNQETVVVGAATGNDHDELGFLIPDKLKERIWNKECIELKPRGVVSWNLLEIEVTFNFIAFPN